MSTDNLWVRNALSDAKSLFMAGFSAEETAATIYKRYRDIARINTRCSWLDVEAVRIALEEKLRVKIGKTEYEF